MSNSESRILISYSGMDLFEKCAGGYSLKYVDRKRVKATPDKTGAIPGKVTHDIAELVNNAFMAKRGPVDDLWEDLVPAMFQKYIQKYNPIWSAKAFAKSEDSAFVEIRKMVLNLRDQQRSLGLYKPFMLSEFWFGTAREPLILNDWVAVQGAVDLFSSDSRTSAGRLVDYKASNSSFFLSRKQLRFYQVALERLNFKIYQCGFILFKKRTEEWFVNKPADLEELVDTLVQIAKKVAAEDFEFTPSKSTCKLCEYIGTCDHAIVEDILIEPPPVDIPSMANFTGTNIPKL